MGRALQSITPMAHNSPPDASKFLIIFWACLLATCPSPLTGQSVEEWGITLGQKYAALGSFRAEYTAISPTSDEPLQGLIIENRETGACLVKLQSDSGKGGAVWWVPQKDGKEGGTYAKFGDSAFRVRGLTELVRQHQKLVSSGNQKKQFTRSPGLAPCIQLGADTISAFLFSATPGLSPAFSGAPPSRVEEIRELKETIELILDDGSWIRLDRKTGLLAGQGYPEDKGKRALRLERVVPLRGEDAFAQEIPVVDPASLKEASAEALQLADVLHAALFHHLVGMAQADNATRPAKLLSQKSPTFRAYWLAAWGHLAPPGIPDNVVKMLRDLKGQKQQYLRDWTAAKEADPEAMKGVSSIQYFRIRRMKLREDLRLKIDAEAKQRPALAHLQLLLDGEISKLTPGQVAQGRELAKLIVDNQRDAMVSALLPKIPEEVLKSL